MYVWLRDRRCCTQTLSHKIGMYSSIWCNNEQNGGSGVSDFGDDGVEWNLAGARPRRFNAQARLHKLTAFLDIVTTAHFQLSVCS